MVHEARVRVRYAETDQMGVAYHANYFVWMEVGRVEFWRAAGVCYRELEEQEGILLTVAETQCRHVYPARYDDEVVIETSVTKAHPRMVVFHYQLKRGADGRLLATGETKHVFCDRDLQPRKLPAKYLASFGLNS
jgi:acyl-CoA thioester hydrolase